MHFKLFILSFFFALCKFLFVFIQQTRKFFLSSRVYLTTTIKISFLTIQATSTVQSAMNGWTRERESTLKLVFCKCFLGFIRLWCFKQFSLTHSSKVGQIAIFTSSLELKISLSLSLPHSLTLFRTLWTTRITSRLSFVMSRGNFDFFAVVRFFGC